MDKLLVRIVWNKTVSAYVFSGNMTLNIAERRDSASWIWHKFTTLSFKLNCWIHPESTVASVRAVWYFGGVNWNVVAFVPTVEAKLKTTISWAVSNFGASGSVRKAVGSCAVYCQWWFLSCPIAVRTLHLTFFFLASLSLAPLFISYVGRAFFKTAIGPSRQP